MSLQQELKRNSSLTLDNGVFYQADVPRNNDFEQIYLSLRKKENRLYSDEIVRQLPGVPPEQKLRREWLVRSISSNKLISYLKKKGTNKSILEIGCGNGWLSNKMATDLSADVVAMDVNEAELLQGARVFSSGHLGFIYGDVFSINLNPVRFDFIVLASCIQYFRNIQSLIKQLLELLTPAGEIHIIDSPLYKSDKALSRAKKRSVDHFTSLGHRDMARYYFHHAMKEIGIFNYKILETPDSMIAVIKRRLFKATHPVFPWIQIKAD